MGELKHDYVVLAVVVVVAIAAVISMATFTPPQQDDSLSQGFVPATGHATTSYADRVPEPQAPDYDFTGDGRLTVEDSHLLAQYILEGRCPSDKTCDLTGDGELTMRDLELFNTMIESPASVHRPEQSARVVQSVSRAPQTESTVGSRLA